MLAVGTSARPRRWGWPVWSPEELARRVHDGPGPVAILFGREDSGLDNESLGRCQAILKIPTAAEPSLNLSQAVLIVCSAIFEEGRRRGRSRPWAAGGGICPSIREATHRVHRGPRFVWV